MATSTTSLLNNPFNDRRSDPFPAIAYGYHPEPVFCHAYRQAAYFQNLLKELTGYLSTTACTPVYASLTELLISWNFNEFAFIREVCSGISTEVENKGSDEFRLELGIQHYVVFFAGNTHA